MWGVGNIMSHILNFLNAYTIKSRILDNNQKSLILTYFASWFILFLYTLYIINHYFGHSNIVGGDIFFPLSIDYKNQILNFFNVYSDTLRGSLYSTVTFINQILPLTWMYFFTDVLGFGSAFSMQILTSLLISIAFLNMSLFLNYLNHNLFFNALLSMFYTFNLYVFCLFYYINFLTAFAFLPLFALFLFQYKLHYKIKYLLYILLLTIPLSVLAQNPPLYLFFILICLFFIIGIQITQKTIYHFLLFSIIYIGLNYYWLVGYIFIKPNSLGANLDFFFTHRDANVLNIITLEGLWQFRDMNASLFAWGKWYISSTTKILYLILFLCVIPAFLYIQRKSILFVLLFLFSIFIGLGINMPFGQLWLFLYENIPGFFILREPMTKVWVPLTFTFIVLISVSYAKFRFIYAKIYKFFYIVLLLVVFFNIYIFSSGKVFPNDRGLFPVQRAIIPEYYKDAARYINELKYNGLLLVLPKMPFYQGHYYWAPDGYYGTNPTISMISNNKIVYESGGGYISNSFELAKVKELYGYFSKKPSIYEINNISRLINELNIEYILITNDLDVKQLGYEKNDDFTHEVINKLEYDKIASFGTFADIENKITTDEFFIDNIKNKLDYNMGILEIYHTKTHKQMLELESYEKSTINNIKKINSSMYTFDIDILEDDFGAINIKFNNVYDRDWTMYCNKENLGKPKIDKISQYSNIWQIAQKKLKKGENKCKIVRNSYLIFKPSLMIFIVTLSFAIFLLIFILIKEFIKNNKMIDANKI